MSFAQSTGSRFGTAVNVERIEPVEYSDVITSTPSTAMTSCAIWTPARAMSSGLDVGAICGSLRPVVRARRRQRSPGIAIVPGTSRCRATTLSSGRVRNFVHSERRTRGKRHAARRVDFGAAGVAALTRPPPRSVSVRCELDLVAREVHERLLERRLLRRQLVERDAGGRRRVADLLRRQAVHLERAALGVRERDVRSPASFRATA